MLALLDHADLDGNLLLAADPFPLEAPRDGVLATPAGVGCGAAEGRPTRPS